MTNKVVQQFFGKGGDSVRVGFGAVWLADLEGGKLLRLDPKQIKAAKADGSAPSYPRTADGVHSKR
jgi:hypothetical protein